MASYGYTFNSGDGVTPTRLNQARTVSDIVDADIKSDAAIALSKLATGALPSAITVASANLVDGTIVNADINASAAIAHSKLANITAGQVLLGNASNVPTATALSGDVTINSSGVTAIQAGVIVNADINASAAIADTKLATISAAGKVSNSATTATSANTASAIVARDGSGNFSAGTVTAALTGNVTGNVTGSSGSCTGNSATATTLATGRNFQLAGDVTSSAVSFNGLAGVTLTGTIANNAVTTAKILDGNVTTAKLATVTQQALLPAGAVMPFARATAPAGWLIANGDAVPNGSGTVQGVTADFSALHAALSTSFGAAGTLPDLRGIFVRGSGSQTISGITYNKTFAAKEAHATGEHTHAISFGYTAAKPTASAFTTGGGGTAINGAVAAGSNEIANTFATDAGLATETRPANIALLYCIKF